MPSIFHVLSDRVWDPCVVIDILAGAKRAEPHAKRILESARRNETRLWVSVFCHVEVAKLAAMSAKKAEALIEAFFGEPFVVTVSIDPFVAKIARELVRNYPGVKGKDAVHVATAARWNVPVMETFDGELVKALKDFTKVSVREPLFGGQVPLELE